MQSAVWDLVPKLDDARGKQPTKARVSSYSSYSRVEYSGAKGVTVLDGRSKKKGERKEKSHLQQ